MRVSEITKKYLTLQSPGKVAKMAYRIYADHMHAALKKWPYLQSATNGSYPERSVNMAGR